MTKAREENTQVVSGLLVGVPLGLAMWALIVLPFI